MSDKKDNGARQSQWTVVNRCLLLLHCLMRGPASHEDLQQIIAEHARDNGEEELTLKALSRRFEEDKSRLQGFFGCTIEREGKQGLYVLTAIDMPLIDLPEDAVKGLAFLKSNFADPAIPMGYEVRALIARINDVLPKKTRRLLEQQKNLLEMDLAVRDAPISPSIQQDIHSTLGRRRLQILYRAAQDDEVSCYDIEPERAYVKNAHQYLYARCYRAYNSAKRGIEGRHIEFRMDRIHETRPLPEHFTPIRPHITELEYVLSPEVARGGVTQHFKNQQVFIAEDGSARVKVASENLFTDLRKLLHYGAACKVVGGDEAVHQMKEIVQQMAERYELI